LPDKPVIVIERSRVLSPINLREIWAARELLYFFVWRDVKVRYKQTLLGVIWVILQPLVMVFVFTLFFGRFVALDNQTSNIPYPLFVLAGLLPWTFFASALNASCNSLINNTSLITKIYFPRALIPMAAVIAGLVDLGIGFVVLSLLMLYFRIGITWNVLLLPVLVFFVGLLALSLGMLLSALNVRFRDIRHALPFVIQVWMFASPVIYPATIVPGRWRWLFSLNPMNGMIEAFRAAFFSHQPIPWEPLAISVLLTLVLATCAAFAFKRLERGFADVI
jgi:lipopolysaccharide transport system permease protein